MTLKALHTVAASAAFALILIPRANAQVSFTGTSSFSTTPNVTQYGFPAFPGGAPPNTPGSGVFNHAEVLSDLTSGFKLSQAAMDYTSVTADVGKVLSINWKLQRADEVSMVNGSFYTPISVTSSMDGTVQASAGITVQSLEEKTYYAGLQPSFPLAPVSDATYSGLSFITDGITNNAFSASSTVVESADVGTNLLWQTFTLNFTPDAAGEVISLSLPGSSISDRFAESTSTPEPAGVALGTALFSVAGMLGLRRRRRLR